MPASLSDAREPTRKLFVLFVCIRKSFGSGSPLYSCGFDHFSIMTTKPGARVRRTRVNQTPAQHLCVRARVSISNCRRRLAQCWSRRRVLWLTGWPLGTFNLDAWGKSANAVAFNRFRCRSLIQCYPILSNTMVFNKRAPVHDRNSRWKFQLLEFEFQLDHSQCKRGCDKRAPQIEHNVVRKSFWPTTGHF